MEAIIELGLALGEHFILMAQNTKGQVGLMVEPEGVLFTRFRVLDGIKDSIAEADSLGSQIDGMIFLPLSGMEGKDVIGPLNALELKILPLDEHGAHGEPKTGNANEEKGPNHGLIK